MQDILTITLNPAVDLSTATDAVSAGPKLRCDTPRTEPGGGGINVSRAIRNLDGASRALVALGGAMGETMAHLLAAERLATIPIPAPGETRHSFAVTDRASGAQYRFVMPGPEWSSSKVKAALSDIADAARPDGYAVLSGSNPPGVPGDFAIQLCAALAQTRLVVDTSGAPLDRIANTSGSGLFLLRMDSEEAETLAGRALPERGDSAAFAAEIVARGAATAVVIARGADGSVMAGPDGPWHAMAADVPVRSKIGAGDSFVGAMVLALARGMALPQALQHGAAAASAAVMTDGTELCRLEDARTNLPLCRLTRL